MENEDEKTAINTQARPLTEQQELFIQYYCESRDKKQSAVKAGYSEKSAIKTVYRLMKDERIRLRVLEFTAEIRKQSAFKVAEIQTELKLVGLSRITDFCTWEDGELKVRDSHDIPEEMLSAIAEITITPTKHGNTIKIKQHNKLEALRLSGLSQGMFDTAELGDIPTVFRVNNSAKNQGLDEGEPSQNKTKEETPPKETKDTEH